MWLRGFLALRREASLKQPRARRRRQPAHQFPRASARGLIEALRLYLSVTFIRSFPRASARGLIEAAPPGSTRTSCRGCFLALRREASLKRPPALQRRRPRAMFPRASARGLIEAGRSTARPSPSPRFPRASARGLIEANWAYDKDGRVLPRFLALRREASLKRAERNRPRGRGVVSSRFGARPH